MSPTAARMRYERLNTEQKLMFWQSLSHAVTIALRGGLHASEKAPTAGADIDEGVRILHILAGHSMSLLDGTADETSIGSLIEAVASYPLLRNSDLEQALTSAEKLKIRRVVAHVMAAK